jgi:putative phage-type endonuclease
VTAIRVPVTQNTPAWLDARRDLIGSSDMPVVTGSSPYATSLLTLWAIKTRLIEPEPPDEDAQELYDLGHALEPAIAERYTAKTGRRVRRVNQLLRHPTIPFLGASLDRVSAVRGERRIVELKFAPHRRWADGPERVPAGVQDQVQAQMLVSGYPVADVAVLNGGRVEVYTIEADRGYQDDLVYLAREKLWRYVETGEMPPVDGSDSTRQTLARLASRRAIVNGTHIRATPDLDAMAQALRGTQTAEKAAHEQVGSIKNAVGAILLAAEASGVDGDGWRIDWHKNADSTKTIRDHEAIAALYRKVLEQALEQQDPTVRGALRDGGWDPDAPDLLDVIEGLHETTETKPGARPMRLWVRGDDGRWV